jgi:hypothetical protein
MDRYRSGVVERHTACRALSAITLALAPDHLFDDAAEARLGEILGERLDAYRADANPVDAQRDVVRLVLAAAEADWVTLERFGLRR